MIPELAIVFITFDCMQMKIIRLGINIIKLAAATIPDAATALFVPIEFTYYVNVLNASLVI